MALCVDEMPCRTVELGATVKLFLSSRMNSGSQSVSKLICAIALFVFVGSTVHVMAGEKLKLVDDKSKIDFVGSKPDKTTHKGGFKKFTAECTADFDEPANSTLKIEIKTDSLWSDNPKLTGHLKNPDFFNVRKYPTATFVATKIEAKDETEVTITGKLKMLDVEEEVKAPFKTEVTDGGVTLTGKFKLDRTKWGMTYGAPDKINKEVELDVVLVFKR